MPRFFLFASLLFFGTTLSTWGQEPAKPQDPLKDALEEKLSPEAQAVAARLRAKLPEGSEGRAMLENILDGSQLGPGEGWFRLAVSETRFPFEAIAKSYDADQDGEINKTEFPGSDEDFQRLDRDQSQSLTEADFLWNQPPGRTPGGEMFSKADQDGNGKVTPEEFQALFRSLDTGEAGYLSLDDLRERFPSPGTTPAPKPDEKQADDPSRSTLVIALEKQELGSLEAGPKLNQVAPDFTLKSLQGEEVTLSKEVGEKPIVLIFGNFTCGPFRSHSGNLEKLYERYKDRAKFFLVYVREAHPSDGWWMTSNERVGIKLPQPQSNAERREVAQTCQKHLKLPIPFLVDTIDDAVGATYSGMPNRLYLIDQEGKIAFKNARGPFGFHPRQLEQALVLLLNQTEAEAKTR